MWVTIVFAFSSLALFLAYGGYLWLLKLLVRIMPSSGKLVGAEQLNQTDSLPRMCVFLSARDEAGVIQDRMANIYDTTYPLDKLQTIIVSDGSKDGTADLARKFANDHPAFNIQVLEYEHNQGQAAAQNDVARLADAHVLVSTDADSRFTKEALARLAAPFGREEVAVVGGVVSYQGDSANPISRGYQTYRGMEQRIRSLETQLGVLVKVDGPCVAYRKSIWSPIESFEDVDQVIVLLARKLDMLAVQEESVCCYDTANEHPRQEIRQRARMTRKALMSTFNRWKPSDMAAHPGFTLALFGHKILRFFSPVFCLLALVSGLILVPFPWVYSIGLIGLAGLMAVGRARGIFVAFISAQVGFLLGIVGWLAGDKSGSYSPTRTYR